MINEKLHIIHGSMIKGLNELDYFNWNKRFEKAKSKAVFETGFCKDNFNFTITVVAEPTKEIKS